MLLIKNSENFPYKSEALMQAILTFKFTELEYKGNHKFNQIN